MHLGRGSRLAGLAAPTRLGCSGSHTHRREVHPSVTLIAGVDLTGCNNNGAPVGSIEEEIDQCSNYITSDLGQSGVWTIACPYGDTGYKSYSQGRFFLGRGVNSGLIAPDGNTDPFNLPVVAAKGGEEASAFNTQIDAAQTQGRWLIFLLHSILPTSNNWYAGVDISSITGSVDHAKELGDVWIDSMVNVGACWIGQRTLAATTPVPASRPGTCCASASMAAS
ncbi:MAG: hypothetical protein JW940_04925 [Polyangiaceae bacterium]|nr:hypothetical protein [Polyangiaceae bacterium]